MDPVFEKKSFNKYCQPECASGLSCQQDSYDFIYRCKIKPSGECNYNYQCGKGYSCFYNKCT